MRFHSALIAMTLTAGATAVADGILPVRAVAADGSSTVQRPRSTAETQSSRRPYHNYRPHSLYGSYYRDYDSPNGYYVPPGASAQIFWWNYGGNYGATYNGYPFDALTFPW